MYWKPTRDDQRHAESPLVFDVGGWHPNLRLQAVADYVLSLRFQAAPDYVLSLRFQAAPDYVLSLRFQAVADYVLSLRFQAAPDYVLSLRFQAAPDYALNLRFQAAPDYALNLRVLVWARQPPVMGGCGGTRPLLGSVRVAVPGDMKNQGRLTHGAEPWVQIAVVGPTDHLPSVTVHKASAPLQPGPMGSQPPGDRLPGGYPVLRFHACSVVDLEEALRISASRIKHHTIVRPDLLITVAESERCRDARSVVTHFYSSFSAAEVPPLEEILVTLV